MILLTLPAFSAMTAYLQGAYAFSVDTNMFSSPLPKNIANDPVYDEDGNVIEGKDTGYSSWLAHRINTAPYFRRYNHNFTAELDIFFSTDAKTGLSLNVFNGYPIKAVETRPNSTDANSSWSYVSSDATAAQKKSLFFGIGPIFRAKFSFLDIGLSLRFSIGTFDTFKENIIVGLQASPYMNFHFSEYMYFTLGGTFDAHLCKFLPTSPSTYYEEKFFMLTLAPYIGFGLRFGER